MSNQDHLEPEPRTWQVVLTTKDSLSSISFDNAHQGIATATDQHLWLTSNDGVTWNERTIAAKLAPGGAYSLAKGKIVSSGTLLVLGQLEEVGSAIFSSVDGGRTWRAKYYENSSLNGIDTLEDESWIVGTMKSKPVVLHSKGQAQWIESWKGQEGYLLGVDFIDVKTGWCVGAKGLVLQTVDGGHSWKNQRTAAEIDLEGVAFTDAKIGYAVGQKGSIFYTADGGNTWKTQDSGTLVTLTDVAAVTPWEAWAVGQKGTVLHTTDGGEHWHLQTLGTRADIYAITIKDGQVWIATSDGTVYKTSRGR
jgi:photosystem II stability/assembly factor-like uncharacterized protein